MNIKQEQNKCIVKFSAYRGTGYRFDWLLGAQFLHSIVVLLLFLCHEEIFSSKVKNKQDIHNYFLLCHVLTLCLEFWP